MAARVPAAFPLGLATALSAAALATACRADGPAPASAAEGASVDFTRDVRPILADRCFACHGADDAQRKAKLRLDTPDGVLAPAASGAAAVVPGKPEESELYLRVVSDDPDERMPPRKSGKAVTPAEAATLKAWVAQGAAYRTHWAFVPPRRPDPPEVRDPGWCRNPVDRFVLARLEREGLRPSPEADRVTLLRRLSLDLTGLPPTPEEVDAFLADGRDDAYARAADRLLDSPHYGERWGRVWLDAARYADSDGYEKDKSRQVWFYRDWVINALNRDLPYDRFVVEQLAGDLLPGATQDQVVATGFLRNSMVNEEGGVDPEQFRMEAMFDRMDAVGKGVLGLTVQCAQCHSHKYDPLSHDEYYRMFAYLNDTHEANVPVYTPREQQARAEVFRRVREAEDALKHANPDWPERLAAWEASMSRDQPEWVVIQPVGDDISNGGQRYLPMPDGSTLAQGYAPTKHRYKMTVRTDLKDIRAFRLELLNDPNLPLNGPGRSVKGTMALTEFEVEAAPADAPGKARKVKFAAASADVNPPETPLESIFDDRTGKRRVTGPASFAVDGDDLTAWGIDVGPVRRNQPRKAVFTAEAPVSYPGGTVLTVYLKQNHGGWNSNDNQNLNLGRFRLSITATPGATADPLPRAARAALAVPADRRSPAESAAVFSAFRESVPEWKDANDRIDAVWRGHPEGSTQLVLMSREAPRETSVLQRGDFLKPLRPVEPGVPAFLNTTGEGEAPADRLSFARWLVDRRAPTTARSLVNRVWQAEFGTGLVATSDDLGTQSEPPSHPELLDWLAVEFMDGGWSLKALHRRIVNSATYRQSSRVTPEGLARDPGNRLLARGPRFRLDAELVRDVALAASGLLDEKVGGPSVFPPAPEFLFLPPVSYGTKAWPVSAGGDRYRRALYTFRYRSVPYPVLQTFDAPNADVSCVRRPRSNTPLQALATLNEAEFLECARALARKAIAGGGPSDAGRLAYAFRRCVARRPSPAEASVLLDLLGKETRRFEGPGVDPWELASGGPPTDRPPLPEGVTPARLAAWTAVARVMLNLDETITRE